MDSGKMFVCAYVTTAATELLDRLYEITHTGFSAQNLGRIR